MKNLYFIIALTILFPSISYADVTYNNLGVVIGNTGLLAGPFYVLLQGISTISGLVFLSWAIFDFKRKGDPANRKPIETSHIIAKLFASSASFALLAFCNEGTQTIFGSNIYIGSITSHPPGSITQCNTTQGVGSDDIANVNAALCIARNIGSNVVPIANESLMILFTLCGILIIMKALKDIATLHSPHNKTTLMKNVVLITFGSVLSASNYFLNSIQNTFGILNGFITTDGQTYSGMGNLPEMFRYTANGNNALTAYSQLESWSFYIMTTIGMFAVARGYYIFFNHFSENPSRKHGIPSAIVFIICGVALFNGKWSTCMLFNTIMGMGLGFCD